MSDHEPHVGPAEQFAEHLLNMNQQLTNELGAVKIEVAELRARAMSVPPAPANSSRPIGRDPKPFSGQRDQVETFLSHVRLLIRLRPDRFSNDTDKCLFTASFFEGSAFSWFQPLLVKDPEELLLNFDKFTNILSRTFGDSFLRENAEDRLLDLKQTGSVAAYSSEFRRRAAHVDINELGLVAIFRRGLKPALQSELLKIRDHFETVQQLSDIAIRMDQRIYFKEPSHHKSHDTHRRPAPNHRRDFAPANPRPTPVVEESMDMELGATTLYKPLTKEEKDRRRSAGLCMYCAKPGHIALRCPAKNRTRTVAATTVSFNLVDPNIPESEKALSKNV